MNLNLQNKVAIVTGGGRDIGGATCIKLASLGASVVVNYFASPDKAKQVVDTITAADGKAVAVQADVTKTAEVKKLVEKTREAFGEAIHILVNNAGGLVARRTFLEMDEAFLDQVMKLNLNSVFLVSQAVVPFMPEGSAIVNISTLAARNGGGAGASAYAASKGAVLTLTRAMAKELAAKKIRVNCVSPGLIDTTFHDMFTTPEVRQKVAAATPINREGTSDEVAHAIVFLAAGTASFITGESIEINGGAYFV